MYKDFDDICHVFFADSLINLHEKDKILLARETALLKVSEKRNRYKKVS